MKYQIDLFPIVNQVVNADVSPRGSAGMIGADLRVHELKKENLKLNKIIFFNYGYCN